MNFMHFHVDILSGGNRSASKLKLNQAPDVDLLEMTLPSRPTTRISSGTFPRGGGPVKTLPGRRGIPKSADSRTLSASWPNLDTIFLKSRACAASTKTRQCWLQSFVDEREEGEEEGEGGV